MGYQKGDGVPDRGMRYQRGDGYQIERMGYQVEDGYQKGDVVSNRCFHPNLAPALIWPTPYPHLVPAPAWLTPYLIWAQFLCDPTPGWPSSPCFHLGPISLPYIWFLLLSGPTLCNSSDPCSCLAPPSSHPHLPPVWLPTVLSLHINGIGIYSQCLFLMFIWVSLHTGSFSPGVLTSTWNNIFTSNGNISRIVVSINKVLYESPIKFFSERATNNNLLLCRIRYWHILLLEKQEETHFKETQCFHSLQWK